MLWTLCWLSIAGIALANEPELWSHLHSTADLGECRDLTPNWQQTADGSVLTLKASKAATRYAWAVIPPPPRGWDLGRHATVEAQVTNRGSQPLEMLLWVVGSHGWDAVPAAATLKPGDTRQLRCDLRETFPDGTPKLDPTRIKQVQIMLARAREGSNLELRALTATGSAPAWTRPPHRLEVPPVNDGPPSPGHRVRYRLAADQGTGIASILYLPGDWKPDAPWPVIVEYPGNIFFTPGCYSTGLPDKCVIGYGMTKGRGAIWLSLPFIDRQAGSIAEHGWGNPDDTAEYALRMVDEVCGKFSGDRRNVVLTGFSRGALACGFIGLRNERIAAWWKGFHACQHYDGDGWNGASMDGALERARRFHGQAVFQTDNSESFFRPVMAAMNTRVTFAQSGLGAHACAMFLDDRPSTQQLRQWFAELVKVDRQQDQQPLPLRISPENP